MKLLRKIFFPFVPIYYLVTKLRNTLYDLDLKKSMSYSFPVICVGNLSVGGTGKTPMIEYLVTLLKDDFSIATLSRGYKRKTKGFQLANKNSTAETLGDEPFQFYNKFKSSVQVAVDSDRQNGINNLRYLKKIPDVVLLDDAFQHRKVKAGLNILLTTCSNLYTEDFVLPTGNLREPKSGAKRAQIIVVTKCPENLSDSKKKNIIQRINPESYQSVFFSSIRYANEVFSKEAKLALNELNDFTLVTGIANATPLVDYLKWNNLNFEHLNFKDHHEFSSQDIKILNKKQCIVTTEKDFMRLKQYNSLKDKLYYLPITIAISNHEKFNSLIKGFVYR